jgi:hypothetical protein
MKYYIMEVLIGTFVTLQKFCGKNIMPELISHDNCTISGINKRIWIKFNNNIYICICINGDLPEET